MEKRNERRKSTFKMSIKKLIILLVVVLATFFTLSFANTINVDNEAETTQLVIQIYEKPQILAHDSIRNKMIEQVKKYIMKTTRGKHDGQLAQLLVDNALEHHIDICFMMSQAKIETCFGTAGAGRASSRRSLFGVINKRWSNYDDAIDDYCKLLKKSYLVRGKTEKDLMRNYVTKSGHRYAGSTTYEADLRNAYRDICNKTNLESLQAAYFKEHDCWLAQQDSIANDTILEIINS